MPIEFQHIYFLFSLYIVYARLNMRLGKYMKTMSNYTFCRKESSFLKLSCTDY